MILDLDAIHTAVKLLSEGKLVAIPTETVYGLAGDARNREAIQKIFRVKNRPPLNPLIIHLSDISAMEGFAREIPKAAFSLAQAFWPGPLTLVLPKHPSVLLEVTGGQDSVAVRVPNHPVALRLLKLFEGGIAAPSANRSGAISPTRPEHVQQGLGSAVDYILDGGPCQVGIESTIVSLLEETPVILRHGHITEQEIAKVLGYEALPATPRKSIEMPGSSLKHYAPSKPLLLLDVDTLKQKILENIERNTNKMSNKMSNNKTNEMSSNKINNLTNNKLAAVLSISLHQEDILKLLTPEQQCVVQKMPWIQLSSNASEYAQSLYAALHKLDASVAESILVETPPSNTAWLAVHDRLTRASTP